MKSLFKKKKIVKSWKKVFANAYISTTRVIEQMIQKV